MSTESNMTIAQRKNWLWGLAILLCFLACANGLFTLARLTELRFYYAGGLRSGATQSWIILVAAFLLVTARKWAYLLAALLVLPGLFFLSIELVTFLGYGPVAGTFQKHGIPSAVQLQVIKENYNGFAIPLIAGGIIFYAGVGLLWDKAKLIDRNETR